MKNYPEYWRHNKISLLSVYYSANTFLKIDAQKYVVQVSDTTMMP
jgi:hypothetical protein